MSATKFHTHTKQQTKLPYMNFKVTLHPFRENPPFLFTLSQVIHPTQQIPPLPSTQWYQPLSKQFTIFSRAGCFLALCFMFFFTFQSRTNQAVNWLCRTKQVHLAYIVLAL